MIKSIGEIKKIKAKGMVIIKIIFINSGIFLNALKSIRLASNTFFAISLDKAHVRQVLLEMACYAIFYLPELSRQSKGQKTPNSG
ncbi:hypothetical protein [Candidatus Protochlamydia phocaeensis]|uniref:hypothetical protein n=1 Tax=Candidatus Protochlamydia phocaeensis TaxID=1414722 RepID=UPI0012AC35C7|nr:hypothetical protein [Candidatus Protochlamydia phocaeensis]